MSRDITTHGDLHFMLREVLEAQGLRRHADLDRVAAALVFALLRCTAVVGAGMLEGLYVCDAVPDPNNERVCVPEFKRVWRTSGTDED